MWLPFVLGGAGFSAFILAGAAWRSFYTGNEPTARTCARYSVALGTMATALGALWLSAAVFWPLEVAGASGGGVPVHLLRGPMEAIAVSSALAVIALPVALLVLRAIGRRKMSARWSVVLERRERPAQ